MTGSTKMMCRWKSWEALNSTTLKLTLPETDSADRSGLLEIATVLCPEVEYIEVFEGSRLALAHIKDDSGAWNTKIFQRN